MKIKQVQNNVRDLRYRKNQMSQQDLADLVGCTRQTIISIEQNKYSPSFVLVKRIAHVFGVTPDEVIQIEFEKA